jgi:hypothetical protein
MALSDELLKKLRYLLKARPTEPVGVVEPPRSVNQTQRELAELADSINALEMSRSDDFRALIDGANGTYVDLGRFIQAMSPYGGELIMFPDLRFDDSTDRTDVSALKRDRNIEVAGWLRSNDVGNPDWSSDSEMSLRDKQECFYWDFRFPDVADTNEVEASLVASQVSSLVVGNPRGEIPKGGQMMNLQITKAIRIPFLYRQNGEGRNGRLLRGHLVIGYEGSGDC